MPTALIATEWQLPTRLLTQPSATNPTAQTAPNSIESQEPNQLHRKPYSQKGTVRTIQFANKNYVNAHVIVITINDRNSDTTIFTPRWRLATETTKQKRTSCCGRLFGPLAFNRGGECFLALSDRSLACTTAFHCRSKSSLFDSLGVRAAGCNVTRS